MPAGLPQFLVTTLTRDVELPLEGRVVSAPPHVAVESRGGRVTVRPLRPGRGALHVEMAGEQSSVVTVSVFREREAFLVTALCSNVHEGWDPSLHDRHPHRECCGPGKRGHAFVHARRMERVLHGAGLPVTWMVDATVARDHRRDLLAWRAEHGDEIALMPPSRSHFNPLNWNTDRTAGETTAMVSSERQALERAIGWPVTSLAIDQFIGSVGTHFAEAAERLGFNALWGMGFDHAHCDTSMHHFGCPWDCYRPSRADFRIPGRDPRPLWVFPWTARDLINTVRVPGGMSGAVMFSTDVDDILLCQVAQHQPDYLERLVAGLAANAADNDFLCVLIHQEDHDSWHEAGLELYARLFAARPSELTPATVGEVAAWLDITHPHPRQPSQRLRLEDPLLCKGQVAWTQPGVHRPSDWGPYPPHIFEWDVDRQVVRVEGEARPLRVIDYAAHHLVEETGAYPVEPLG